MSKGSFSISASQGRVAQEHDARLYMPNNADRELSKRNVYIKTTDNIPEAFNALFRGSITTYNEKQTRNDRIRSYDYYSDIAHGKCKEKTVYEYVIQIGNRDTLGLSDSGFDYSHWRELRAQGKFMSASKYALAHENKDPRRNELKELLANEMRNLENNYPQLHFWNIVLHDDEPDGTCHAHIAFTPVAKGYANGMPVRDSLTKALNQMGFYNAEGELAITKWQNDVKEKIQTSMESAGYERAYMDNTDKHLSVSQFKLAKQKESLIEQNTKLLEENMALSDRNKELREKNQLLFDDNRFYESEISAMQEHQKSFELKTSKALDDKQAELDSREDDLKQREQYIQTLEAELSARTQQLDLQKREHEDKEKQLASLEESLKLRETKINQEERYIQADNIKEKVANNNRRMPKSYYMTI